MTIVRDRPRYDEDYHLWVHDQAARLRAMAGLRANEPIDWELLAEEVEGLARTDYRSCCSFIDQIVAHLLKLEYSRQVEPRDHWAEEVVGFRSELEDTLTASLTREVRPVIEKRYGRAVRKATRSLASVEPDLAARCLLYTSRCV